MKTPNESPKLPSDENPSAVKEARRRLLLSGAKLAPVVAATLASRPALACHCVAPSAWGSVVAAAPTGPKNTETLTGSLAHHQPKYYSTWTIVSWKTTNDPWYKLRSTCYSSLDLATVKGKTLSQICSKTGLALPIGADSNQTISSLIGVGSGFQCAIMVAQLNMFLGTIPTGETGCGLTLANLKSMASSGSFQPAYGSAWSQTAIEEYLHHNWLARRTSS